MEKIAEETNKKCNFVLGFVSF